MNWSKDRSLFLSKFCIYLFMAILFLVCLTAPWLFTRLLTLLRPNRLAQLPWFLTSTYLAAMPAAVALLGLRLLLRNITMGQVFTRQNVAALRLLSWCCIAAGLVCLASTLYYLPFLLVSAAAAFVGLIVRVVKNVFAQALALQEENDYTI